MDSALGLLWPEFNSWSGAQSKKKNEKQKNCPKPKNKQTNQTKQTKHSYVESPTHNVTIFGDRIFIERIKVK